MTSRRPFAASQGSPRVRVYAMLQYTGYGEWPHLPDLPLLMEVRDCP